jgi:hypothetical protein
MIKWKPGHPPVSRTDLDAVPGHNRQVAHNRFLADHHAPGKPRAARSVLQIRQFINKVDDGLERSSIHWPVVAFFLYKVNKTFHLMKCFCYRYNYN